MVGWSTFRVPEVKWGIGASAMLVIFLVLYLSYVNKLGIIHGKYWDYISISATLLGFLITAYAILITFPENHKIRVLKANRNYKHIFDIIMLPMYPLISLLILSLIGFFLEINHPIYDFVITFMLIWSVIGVIEAVWVLKELTRIYLSVQESVNRSPTPN
jgi:hypothetical protein